MNQISVFDSPKPAFTAEEAQHLLKRDYGIDGKLKELVSERDQNFLVGSPAGKFVLKIANAVEDEGFLALQNAAMKHVAQADPSLGLQRVRNNIPSNHNPFNHYDRTIISVDTLKTNLEYRK